ncbi:hypothetical protein BO70DRAFT_393330 [Aspergillus heteromorphus CBS 117.55]|uniref:Uncharacterized protein n=1 Tax=Aspergillus heteromorphus CBS 117.55 TaxID=1448321 RepID=A0A317WVN8_9EURO|nr:uncharacterized protein BO70DRAFT_393330 [Aspergillus heteromorphus CBS 117.55]PWY90145.1 hypothetical protein BO70DRAFT_393330 [Aspergillus heteromorphus CBS 117.55]
MANEAQIKGSLGISISYGAKNQSYEIIAGSGPNAATPQERRAPRRETTGLFGRRCRVRVLRERCDSDSSSGGRIGRTHASDIYHVVEEIQGLQQLSVLNDGTCEETRASHSQRWGSSLEIVLATAQSEKLPSARDISSNEARRYLPVGKVRIEDDILAIGTRSENLTTAPKGEERKCWRSSVAGSTISRGRHDEVSWRSQLLVSQFPQHHHIASLGPNMGGALCYPSCTTP